jgi:CopG-like RHH_1 or ribbon-helix-helix domain, RHH_5
MQTQVILMTEKVPGTKRTTIVLPARVYELLEQRASMEGRATANLAAFVVEQYIRECFPEEFPNPYTKRKSGGMV